jgi:predicted MFS family arabinose efflux permease
MDGSTRLAPPIRTSPASTRYRAYVLGVLVAVGIVGWVDRNVFAILLESIKTELVLSDTALGLLGGVAFGLFYATLGLPVAWLADRCERRSLLAAALALWSLMTAACGLASGFVGLFLARVGVGVGEAGGAPASVSLVADYFAPERRAFALGVLYLYVPGGFVVGYLIGGWLDDLVGWRTALLLIGLPGLALAVLVRATLREPPRGRPERESSPVPPLLDTLRYFWARRTLRHVPLAGAIHGIGAFAAALWLPAFYMRTFDVSSTTAGLWLALAYGGGGIVGVVAGGQLADRIVARTRDQRWYALWPAAVLLGTVPCTLALYLTDSAPLAVAAAIAGALLGHAFLGPVGALMQNLAGPKRRATAAAFYLFLVNLVSMGCGPVAVGLISDGLSARLGDDALRYALLVIVTVTTLLAAWHFVLAARTVKSDLALAGDGDGD